MARRLDQPLHVISLGAGVQSSAMALMAARGEIGPMPTCAIFADTQDEPASVYRWLDWLEPQLPFPVHRVTAGCISETSLRLRQRKDGGAAWAKSLIPAFVKNPDGSRGIMGRACTADFKIAVIIRKEREMVGVASLAAWKTRHAPEMALWRAYKKEMAAAKKENRMPRLSFPQTAWDSMQADSLIVQWIGISLDEIFRVKQARDPWIKHRWPLVFEGRQNRHDCLLWMQRNGYPKPPRSACRFCPFHSDAEWRRLRDEEPEDFALAVQFERDLQIVKARTTNIDGVPYLHESMVPLGDVDFSTDHEHGQQDLFINECEGMCGL